MADNAEARERHGDSSSINVLERSLSGPDPQLSDDLVRVAGVLHDMTIAADGTVQPVSPGIPPAAFGAGGTL
jgi:hypothetical protein